MPLQLDVNVLMYKYLGYSIVDGSPSEGGVLRGGGGGLLLGDRDQGGRVGARRRCALQAQSQVSAGVLRGEHSGDTSGQTLAAVAAAVGPTRYNTALRKFAAETKKSPSRGESRRIWMPPEFCYCSH